MHEKPRSRVSIPFGVWVGLGGIAIGFILSSSSSFFLNTNGFFFNRKQSETLFGLEGNVSGDRGKEFGGQPELKSLPDADRELFRQASHLVLAHLGPGETIQSGSMKARKALQSASDQNPNHPWIHYLKGRLYEKTHQLDSAQRFYQKALEVSPQFAYPLIRLGRMQMESGEFGKARTSYGKAIDLMAAFSEDYAPEENLKIPVCEIPPYDYLATLFFQTGFEDSALMAIQYAQEKGWKSNQMSLVQGWLWEAHGFLNKADSTYRNLIQKEPTNTDYSQAWITLGWKPPSPRGTTRPMEAEASFAISLLDPLARQYPKNAALWMALGQAYHHRGLYAMAVESFDSSLRYDSTIPNLRVKRDLAYDALLRSNSIAIKSSKAALNRSGTKGHFVSSDDEGLVVIPGSLAILGSYGVAWGSSPTQMREAYPKKEFLNLTGGNLFDTFILDGFKHEYRLAFKEGKLWGIQVVVSDSSGQAGDVFGRMLRTKVKISGEGKATGDTKCPGFRSFQGVVWESDDTFEFMAQFQGKEQEVRLIRLENKTWSQGKRLCDIAAFLQEEAWK